MHRHSSCMYNSDKSLEPFVDRFYLCDFITTSTESLENLFAWSSQEVPPILHAAGSAESARSTIQMKRGFVSRCLLAKRRRRTV